MPMTNMKKEPEVEEMPGEVEMDECVYPEGLQVELETDDLEKLGLSVPMLNRSIKFEAEAVVSCVSAEETFGGMEYCVTLQITDMNIISIGGAKARTLLS